MQKTVLACLMLLRTAVRLFAVLALFALPAEALGASVVRTSSVTGKLVAPAGHGATLGLHCPPSAVALNGAVTRSGSGVEVRRSLPGKDVGAWSFRVAGSGSGSRAVTAVVRCVRLELPAGVSGAQLSVKTRRTPDVVVPAGGTATPRLACGSAWSATGYALDGGYGAVRFAQARPRAHGWWFTLENTGSAPQTVRASIRCVRTKVTATSGAELRFRVVRQSFERAFGAGSSRREAAGRCSAKRINVAAGIQLDPADPFELLGASPSGSAGARWLFGNVSAGDGFRAYMVCLGRGSRFH
jgi:hypothetical protein